MDFFVVAEKKRFCVLCDKVKLNSTQSDCQKSVGLASMIKTCHALGVKDANVLDGSTNGKKEQQQKNRRRTRESSEKEERTK